MVTLAWIIGKPLSLLTDPFESLVSVVFRVHSMGKFICMSPIRFCTSLVSLSFEITKVATEKDWYLSSSNHELRCR